jgi:hypothetical protein
MHNIRPGIAFAMRVCLLNARYDAKATMGATVPKPGISGRFEKNFFFGEGMTPRELSGWL